jgi:hypothetical protein
MTIGGNTDRASRQWQDDCAKTITRPAEKRAAIDFIAVSTALILERLPPAPPPPAPPRKGAGSRLC